MKLADWRNDVARLTQAELARELGVSQPIVSAMEADDNPRIPREKRVLVRLFRLSGGAVTPNDFFELPDLNQPELPLEAGPAPLLVGVE